MKSKTSNRQVSIKAKLIFIIIPIVIIGIIALLTIIFESSKKIIVDDAKQLVASESNAHSNEIETWSQEILSSLNSSKNALDNATFTPDTLLKFIKSTMNQNDSFPDGIYIGDDQQNITIGTNFVPPAGYVVTERGWFKEGLKNEKFQFGAIYLDVATSNYVASVSAKLKQKDNITRVAAADISLANISKLVSTMSVLDTGVVFLVDQSDNTIIAHKDANLVTQKIDENNNDPLLAGIAKNIKSGNEDVFTINTNNGTYIANLNKIENTSWVMVSYVPQSEVLKPIDDLKKVIYIFCLIIIVFLTVLIERVVHIIIKPIKKLTAIIVQITNGDFTVNIDTRGNDEVASMNKSMQAFIDKMRIIFKDLGNMSDQLSSQAENSSGISEKLFMSAKTQFSSMSELNTTVDELAKSVGEVAESATKLALDVSQAGQKGDLVSQKMKETVVISEEGRKDMEDVNLAMGNIERTVISLEDTVKEVGEATGKISDFVNFIGNIATQTNLLSLNAAIEAARAGEAGRGFSVVAEEIRKLAENSADSVSHIAELTTNINLLVHNTIEKTKESADSIKSSIGLVNTASTTFGNIYITVSETNNIVQDMIENVKNVDQIATTVAAITEEQSAGAEEILATAESLSEHASEITVNSELVGKDADELAQTAERLDKQIRVFKI